MHCLRTRRHYLLGSRFVVKTDNVATSYFQTQKKLSPKQARWQDFLAEIDFRFEYKPGKANQVADALSRKAELAALSKPEGILLDLMKEGLKHDKMAQDSIKAVEHERTKVFQVEDGLLLYKKDKRLYVPDWFNLRRSLVWECHDTKWAGHQELSVQGPCLRKLIIGPKCGMKLRNMCGLAWFANETRPSNAYHAGN